MEKPFLLDFDANQHAVLDPGHKSAKLHYHFPKKLLFAFITTDAIQNFLRQYPHQVVGIFKCFMGETEIYEVELAHEKITFCQALMGASSAVQLLDWTISYGVQQILAVGSAGVLSKIPENYFLVPTKAIRDEGTSFHYAAPANIIDLQSDYLTSVEKLMVENKLKVKEVMTWSTDGFFRETAKKVAQFKKLGASCVEMECAALAACAQFRHADFAQILFTADSLSTTSGHEDRGWGRDAHGQALALAAAIMDQI
ncbi:nucleoside phosphorylase [Lactobacillus sp. ESL0791]|uniref:nucleoside phosphorylase n=1 Tax=Lactobacillus sp. ESL0791 TaxID=2983234 RepID=UPI0023F6733F|nr:nucleoside phosphorylase [Lactobacillus sp. ESL0791]MDF7639098.1 nucleoside phosphorylase [Lactobacillus sp. ESL0791]